MVRSRGCDEGEMETNEHKGRGRWWEIALLQCSIPRAGGVIRDRPPMGQFPHWLWSGITLDLGLDLGLEWQLGAGSGGQWLCVVVVLRGGWPLSCGSCGTCG